MSRKLRVAIWSNALFIKTGLSRNAKALLKEFYKSEKYDLFHYCSGVNEADPKLERYPWKTVGCLPSNPQEIHSINQDPHKARVASYGNTKIKDFVEKYKIDVLIALDDLWAVSEEVYNSEWIKGINFFFGCTLDSIPLIESTKDVAMKCKFVSWAKFGESELKNELKKHNLKPDFEPITIHGAVESEHYTPISQLEKMNFRKKFNIPQDSKIFFYLGRNQLRKKFDSLLQAYASYKKQNPQTKSKILLHTSWTEGWDLKRIINSLEIDNNDILTTHVCSNCKEFTIKPYEGEGCACPYCHTKDSLGSVSIINGVSDEDMKYIYGISDASISLFTSGGQELFNIESAFMALPLATVSYSCGSDYTCAPNKLVYEVDWTPTREIGSCFIKAEPRIPSVVKFMKKIEDMSEKDIREWGLKLRKWALGKFDSKIIAKKWMEQIDKCEPIEDWSKVKFDDNKKLNPNFQPDFSLEGEQYIKNLYSGFLDAQHPDDQGLQHWKKRLDNGESKEQIASIFQQIAHKDSQPKEINVKDLLPKNDKKNLLFVIKESLGDCILCLNLLKSCKNSYPEHNINIVTETKFFPVFEGCEYVDNLIPYSPLFEQELYVIGAGQKESIADVFIMPAVATQKCLNYLSNNQPELLKRNHA